ncbi:MAG: gliding motility-associated C-terminal domain-containing protein [Bacteroidales bacterium]|nr:gliding motility-associated C-terminal domain-containing protein [Bacteroidales bacterium]
MKKVIFTILLILLSVVATSQDIYFEIKRVDSSNLNPKIYNVKKLNGEPINEELKIYRKYSYETEYQPIATKTFSPLDNSFEDESISVCYNYHLDTLGNNIYYYITNNDSTSFSDKKGDNFGDSNFPEWPTLTNLDIEDDNLVLHWKPSASDDIYYYELRRKNSSNTWDPITTYDNYTPTITIAENICGNIDNFPYTIFAYDSCGKSSKLGDLELDSTLQLYPPILDSVEYNCNTLTFKWNKNRSLRGEISGCKIQYKLDETAQEIKDIDIPLSDIETTESDYQSYSLKVSVHPELSNTNPLFRIRTTDGQDISSNTCWSDPVPIGEIPEAPDLSIVFVNTNSNNSYNSLKLIIKEDKSTNHFLGREYIFAKEYGNNTQVIWIKNDDTIFYNSNIYIYPYSDKDISNINSDINYRLSVVYKCNNDTLGKAYFNSIYLDTIGNDTEITLSWNSISTNQYNDITYNVVRTYNGEEHSEDVQNNTTYTEDLSFIDPNSFKPVKWYVEAFNNGYQIARSNTITRENSGDLLMPDAFIPDSDIPINRFFGPMNNFDENNIKKYSLRIFNNTGTLIWSTDKYSSDDLEISRWDGTDFRGQPCVRGTYIYDVYVELNGSFTPLTARGTVTLIRKN